MTWQALDAELGRWRDLGRVPSFWWRDDDATLPSPALGRLLALARRSSVPLALAVVPLEAAPELFEGLEADVVMHGTDHRNRAAAGAKKSEFPADEPLERACERLRKARERLAELAGARFVPVLAPPWNRFRRDLIPCLPGCGLRGLSGYGERQSGEPVRGVREVNTHIDIVEWRRTRSFAGEDATLSLAVRHLAARREGAADTSEPTGLLTHHAVHDAPAWAFVERFVERTREGGGEWLPARRVFSYA